MKKIYYTLCRSYNSRQFFAYKNLSTLKDCFISSPLAALYIKYFRDKEAIDADHLRTTLDNGMSIIVNRHDRCVCWFVRLAGRWDRNETNVVKKLVKPGHTVIEVGANFGCYTLLMAGLVGETGQIYAFEANPNVSKYLKQSVAMNNLDGRVHVYENAASNKAYEGFMTYGLSNIGGGYLLPDDAQQEKDNPFQASINAVTLDDTIGGKHVDILKMDAEGSEGSILEGAQQLLKNNPHIVIIMEWVPAQLERNGANAAALISNLANDGFKFWRINKQSSVDPISPSALLTVTACDLVISRSDINTYFKE
jgi:methyltransferase, FkbM family